jgi:hypothetical protein
MSYETPAGRRDDAAVGRITGESEPPVLFSKK